MLCVSWRYKISVWMLVPLSRHGRNMMMVYLDDRSAGGGEDETSNEWIEIRRG